MKFSHFIELITINKPTDGFYLEIVIFLVIQDFACFALTINIEFEIIFLNVLFS